MSDFSVDDMSKPLCSFETGTIAHVILVLCLQCQPILQGVQAHWEQQLVIDAEIETARLLGQIIASGS